MAITYTYELDIGAGTSVLGLKDSGTPFTSYTYEDATGTITPAAQTGDVTFTLLEFQLFVEAVRLWMVTFFAAWRPADTVLVTATHNQTTTATLIALVTTLGGATSLDVDYNRATSVVTFHARASTVGYWSDLKVWFEVVERFYKLCAAD